MPARKSPFSLANLKAAGLGAVGGLAGFIGANILISPFFQLGLNVPNSFGSLALAIGLMVMVIGTVLSGAILAYDNQAGLRGRWDRDLWRGLPLFALVGFLAGSLGQVFYGVVGITRALPWMLMGGGIGAAIGLLRRDKTQAQRGAMGGAIGGLIGGVLVDVFLSFSYTNAAFGNATLLGMIIMGAMIALLIRVVQDAMQEAWLLGISTGPYEGKEYPLNTERITVGRASTNDISLYRQPDLATELGAFVFQSGGWWWQGTTVPINGMPQSQAALQPGDTIQLGATQFRLLARSLKTPAAAPTFPPISPAPSTPPPYNAPYNAAPPVAPPAAPFMSPPPSYSPLPVSIVGGQLAVGWMLHSRTPGAAPINLPPAPARAQLGRAPQNQIVVSDPTVSSTHALLDIGADQLTITDLNSTNGTLLNGVRITPNVAVILQPNDTLTLGRLEYSVVRNGK